MRKINVEETMKEMVDYLYPLQTPYEQAIYNYLFRWSYLEGYKQCRKGKRTIAVEVAEASARGTKGKGKISYQAITENVNNLAKKGHIKIGDVTREGTLYRIFLPGEIGKCIELMQKKKTVGLRKADYFTDSKKRLEIFKRDGWKCHYCEEEVNEGNATLDHLKPSSKGGDNSKENLVACCLECNAIKSGKTPSGADALLLKKFKEKLKREKHLRSFKSTS